MLMPRWVYISMWLRAPTRLHALPCVCTAAVACEWWLLYDKHIHNVHSHALWSFNNLSIYSAAHHHLLGKNRSNILVQKSSSRVQKVNVSHLLWAELLRGTPIETPALVLDKSSKSMNAAAKLQDVCYKTSSAGYSQ